MIDFAELDKRKTLDYIANIVCGFDKHPGTNFRGLIAALDILYKKRRSAASDPVFEMKEPLLDTLMFFVFPYGRELTSEQSATFCREIATDPGIVTASLSLLKSFCTGNCELTQKMARCFSSYLTQPYLVHMCVILLGTPIGELREQPTGSSTSRRREKTQLPPDLLVSRIRLMVPSSSLRGI